MLEFRLRLQHELLERNKKNPRYSLRSFARQLEIEPSALSKILRDKRQITRKMLTHLSDRLGLSPQEQAEYAASLNDANENSGTEYRQLSLDLFAVIADWYHYAILELTHLKHFQTDAKWIAGILGISVNEVHAAVERLQRLEMLEIHGKRWKDVSGAVTTVGTEPTAAAFRRLQKQLLLKAIDAMEEIPVDARDNSSITMAIDSRRIPEAKQKIKKFRRNLCRFLKSGNQCDAVYNLSTAFFPLTKIGSKNA